MSLLMRLPLRPRRDIQLKTIDAPLPRHCQVGWTKRSWWEPEISDWLMEWEIDVPLAVNNGDVYPFDPVTQLWVCEIDI